MIKVRTGDEDVFIAKTYHYDNTGLISDIIPDKYHFHFNPR
jgi:hypothetical protein